MAYRPLENLAKFVYDMAKIIIGALAIGSIVKEAPSYPLAISGAVLGVLLAVGAYVIDRSSGR